MSSAVHRTSCDRTCSQLVRLGTVLFRLLTEMKMLLLLHWLMLAHPLALAEPVLEESVSLYGVVPGWRISKCRI